MNSINASMPATIVITPLYDRHLNDALHLTVQIERPIHTARYTVAVCQWDKREELIERDVFHNIHGALAMMNLIIKRSMRY